MSYELTSKDLLDYIYHRIYDPTYKGYRVIDVDFSEDKKSLVLSAPKSNKVVMKPKFIEEKQGFGRIEIEIESHKAGINSTDFSSFLEQLIEDDCIFGRGQALFSYERQEELPKWKTVLERKRGVRMHKMSCSIINRNVSTERLRKTIYEYMVRPCIYYLFHMGNFSKQ